MPAMHRSAPALAVAIAGVLTALAPVAFAMQADDALAYYVEAFVNGRDTGFVVRLDRIDGSFRIAADELTDIGIRVDNLPLDADRQIALDAVPQLRYVYREQEQRLELTLPDAQLVPERIGYEPPPPPPPQTGAGLLLNYAAHLQSTRVDFERKRNSKRLQVPLHTTGRYGSQPLLGEQEFQAQYERRNRTLAVNGELRFFSRAGIFVNTGYATVEAGEYDYVRQDTYWTNSDVSPMRTWTVGDFISSSLAWSRSIHLGGASVSRNFDVRPDLLTFPVPVLGGSAVVPTTVDLYINGLRQFSGEASGGPFVIASPPALTGAGRATLVYEDLLGRQMTINQPLYIDTRLLGRGFTDYAIEVGYPRRSYGSRSFDYASSLAANASMRRGMSDRFTLEAHAELADGLQNLGIGGLLEVGRLGVIDGAFVSSNGDLQGSQLSLGYQYQSPRLSIVMQGIRTRGDYRDLGSLNGVPVPGRQVHASVAVPIGQRHSVSLFYARQDASLLGGSRIVSFGYSGAFGSRVNVFANVFRDMDLDNSMGAYLGVSITLDKRISVSGAVSRYGDERTASVMASRPVDYDRGGFGWNVLLDSGNDGYQHGAARLDYRGRHVEVSAQLERSRRDDISYTNTSLFAAGALVYMDGDLMASRAIPDAFAVASTNGIAGVPVLRENRPVGTTNREGHLLIPDLLSWQSNRIAIESRDLPIDINVGADRLDIAPRAQSGVLAQFPLERFSGATVVLLDQDGQPLALGTVVTLREGGDTALVGYDGQVFFPTLEPVNTASAQSGDATCEARIVFDPADTMQTIGPFTCINVEAPP